MMTTMMVNLCVKKQDELIKYNNFNQLVFRQAEESANVNFQFLTIKEVKSLPKKTKKKYYKIAVSFLVTIATYMVSVSKSMASTVLPSTSNGIINIPVTAHGLPPELMQIFGTGLVILVAVAVLLCMAMLMGAGLLRAMRKKKEASEWTGDIIKGLVQVLLAPPIIFLIFYIATILFTGSSWFINPFVIR